MNERTGTEFAAQDALFLEQVVADAASDTTIQQAARVNTIDDFELVFGKVVEGLFVQRMDLNRALYKRLTNDPGMGEMVARALRDRVYAGVRGLV